MPTINMLVNYKGVFGSKQAAPSYRMGMDQERLKHWFLQHGYTCQAVYFEDIDLRHNNYQGQIFIYTSSEDIGYIYKSYIEDIVYALELAGAIVVPGYKFLRANNNKVFMELLRDSVNLKPAQAIQTKHFGALEQLKKHIDTINLPAVVKMAAGSCGAGVFLGKTKNDLVKVAATASKVIQPKTDFRDFARTVKHKGYVPESRNRRKFIVQNFVPGLQNDWKVLVYGDKQYVLYRSVRENDFRASGSHKFKKNEEMDTLPPGMFEFCYKMAKALDLPWLSLDIAWDGKQLYLIEFQAVHFGTYTQETAEFYYALKDDTWQPVRQKLELEQVYVDALVDYINTHYKPGQ